MTVTILRPRPCLYGNKIYGQGYVQKLNRLSQPRKKVPPEKNVILYADAKGGGLAGQAESIR